MKEINTNRVLKLVEDYKNADDYLVLPFFDTINSKTFSSSIQIMKIIVGATGQGKTFSTATIFIPELIKEKKVDLVVVSVPQTEILDKEIFEDVVANMVGVHYTNDVKEAKKLLKRNKKVVLTTTHSSFSIQDKGKDLQDYMIKSGKQFAIFIDEAHTWLVSSWENYRITNGWNATVVSYEATLFKSLDNLSKYSPYIFGLTATPNAEQLNKVETVGGMKFQVINDFAPLELLIGKTAWFKGVTYYDKSFKNQYDILDKYETAIMNLYGSYFKKTMLVAVGNDGVKNGYDIKNVKRETFRILRSNGLISSDEQVIAVMSYDKSIQGSYADDGSFTKLDDDEIKEKLNDANNSLRILIVVQKGKMGMNVFNLKSLVSFRASDKNNGDGESLVEFAIQLIGRLVRLNTGLSNSEFTSKYGYDIETYVKTLSDDEVSSLIEANSMDILIPDTTMWKNAIEQFKKNYVSSVQSAKAWINAKRK